MFLHCPGMFLIGSWAGFLVFLVEALGSWTLSDYQGNKCDLCCMADWQSQSHSNSFRLLYIKRLWSSSLPFAFSLLSFNVHDWLKIMPWLLSQQCWLGIGVFIAELVVCVRKGTQHCGNVAWIREQNKGAGRCYLLPQCKTNRYLKSSQLLGHLTLTGVIWIHFFLWLFNFTHVLAFLFIDSLILFIYFCIIISLYLLIGALAHNTDCD